MVLENRVKKLQCSSASLHSSVGNVQHMQAANSDVASWYAFCQVSAATYKAFTRWQAADTHDSMGLLPLSI